MTRGPLGTLGLRTHVCRVDAARSFRLFFEELRDVFVERESLLTQLELALLCREHLLAVGPSGTGKSALLASAGNRIVDADSGAPSFFTRQLTESTVQNDLVGPVDFKVLTESGRTRHLTDEGMLGARYALLDEVFDGRDMLLRSALALLNEREFSCGNHTAKGRLSCVVMTSNRFLSEVIHRSPELLSAFADRIAFVNFVPGTFAHAENRLAMLEAGQRAKRPVLRTRLTHGQLDELRNQVDQVNVPIEVVGALDRLAQGFEQALRSNMSPDAAIAILSPRARVRALWVLKASVVHDRIVRHPARALEARQSDLSSLQHLFVLGGPAPEDLEPLLALTADSREREQLEQVRAGRSAFSQALEEALSPRRPALEVDDVEEEVRIADAVNRTGSLSGVEETVRRLRRKLNLGSIRGWRRNALLSAARLLLGTIAQAGADPSSELLLASLDLARAAAELSAHLSQLITAATQATQKALAKLLAQLDADILLATKISVDVVERAAEVERVLESWGDLVRELGFNEALNDETDLARDRAVALLTCLAELEVRRGLPAVDPWLPWLAEKARWLGDIEVILGRIRSLPVDLKTPLFKATVRRCVEEVFVHQSFERLSDLASQLERTAEALRREQLLPLTEDGRLSQILSERVRPLLSVTPSRWTLPTAKEAKTGGALLQYRIQSTQTEPWVDVVRRIQSQLRVLTGTDSSDPDWADLASRREFSELSRALEFLQTWWEGIQPNLGLEALVESRLPELLIRDGELIRLRGIADRWSVQNGQDEHMGQAIHRQLDALEASLRNATQSVASPRTAA